jgi:hypothetical protein
VLTVRKQQIALLGNERRHRFAERLTGHARAHFPEVCRELGHELGMTVHECIRQGQEHGLSTERELCKYLNLVFTFGRNFDRDPMCSWASDILHGALPGPMKIARLYEAAIVHEHEARGFFALIGFQDA